MTPTIANTGGAHCTGIGCEHDPLADAIPGPVHPPRHRTPEPARHRAAQPPSRPTSSTRRTGTP